MATVEDMLKEEIEFHCRRIAVLMPEVQCRWLDAYEERQAIMAMIGQHVDLRERAFRLLHWCQVDINWQRHQELQRQQQQRLQRQQQLQMQQRQQQLQLQHDSNSYNCNNDSNSYNCNNDSCNYSYSNNKSCNCNKGC